jgi:bifunctional DNA-binding transcriptional regulator/antitoxin component of YhaV-PrlF toxin-antitoxin module
LKIASKRQLTVPQRLLSVLALAEGDEIQITVEDGRIVSAQPCKSVPTALLPDDLMSKIKAREKLLAEGKGIDVDEALSKISTPV